jgi:hypothetical protein
LNSGLHGCLAYLVVEASGYLSLGEL